jgi:hypothetical protein
MSALYGYAALLERNARLAALLEELLERNARLAALLEELLEENARLAVALEKNARCDPDTNTLFRSPAGEGVHAGVATDMISAYQDRCPDCAHPLATEADYAAEGNGAHLCWRAWNDDHCAYPPVNWRARALAAEAERVACDRVNAAALVTIKRLEKRWDIADIFICAVSWLQWHAVQGAPLDAPAVMCILEPSIERLSDLHDTFSDDEVDQLLRAAGGDQLLRAAGGGPGAIGERRQKRAAALIQKHRALMTVRLS